MPRDSNTKKRGHMQPSSQIATIKAYVPDTVVPNQFFEDRFNFPEGSIEARTGLRSRRRANSCEYPTEMGVKAAQMVFREAGIPAQNVDLIIAASCSRDQAIPTDAMIYANRLGIPDVQCLYVDVGCQSFVNALEIADLYIRSGKRKSILIVTSEQTSRVIDYDDPSSSIVLGDGAAAALVVPSSGPSQIEASCIKTEALGRNLEVATLKGGGLRYLPDDPDFTPDMKFFRMDGALALRLASRYLPSVVDDLLQEADCTAEDIDHIIPHQVIPRMIRSVQKKFGVNAAKVYINADYGNQAAATIPIGLAELVSNGTVRRGDRVLLIGGATGFTAGGMILIY